ncbi:MAG: hypothetical protein PHG36_05290 [Dehalococcoidia bacterium]|nr:hypothetical protein [Dehalococcoidia bacterium]
MPKIAHILFCVDFIRQQSGSLKAIEPCFRMCFFMRHANRPTIIRTRTIVAARNMAIATRTETTIPQSIYFLLSLFFD